jgi:hypothetical protein
VEAGSNTPTVTLRVVGGDEKGSFESETVIMVTSPTESDPKMSALTRAGSNCKRQACPLVRESAPYQQTRKCLTELKNLVISPRRGLDTKTDWLTDRRS